MKAAVVAVLLVMVAAASARECDMMARLNVKQQWMRAYSHGEDREHFAEAVWRALVFFMHHCYCATVLIDCSTGLACLSYKISHSKKVQKPIKIGVNVFRNRNKRGIDFSS